MLDEAAGVDHQRVAILVMADGFTVPGRARILAVLLIEIDVPHELIAFPDHDPLRSASG
jgi:hypothetical protein